jgi:hypothetical protein
MLTTIHSITSLKGYSDENSPDSSLNEVLARDPSYRKAWAAKFLHYLNPAYRDLSKATTWGEIDKALKALDVNVANDHSLENRLNQLFAPVYLSIGDAWARDVAKHRMIALAISIMRQRKTLGHLPKVASASDPFYLDPFDLKPLRFQAAADGFTLYSVGGDLKDDKGLTEQEARRKNSLTRDVVMAFK